MMPTQFSVRTPISLIGVVCPSGNFDSSPNNLR